MCLFALINAIVCCEGANFPCDEQLMSHAPSYMLELCLHKSESESAGKLRVGPEEGGLLLAPFSVGRTHSREWKP